MRDSLCYLVCYFSPDFDSFAIPFIISDQPAVKLAFNNSYPFIALFKKLARQGKRLEPGLLRESAAALADKLRTGTVLCAGLVAGEALTGIFLAVPIGLDIALPLRGLPWDSARSLSSLLVLLALPLSIHWSLRRPNA